MERTLFYLLVIFAFLAPVSRTASGSFFGMACIIWLILLKTSQMNFKKFFDQPLIRILGLLYIGLMVSVVFSLDIRLSIREYWKMITYIFPILLLAANACCMIKVTLDSTIILQSYFLGCIVSSMYAIFQYLQTQSLNVTSFFVHHAAFGSILELGIPISMILFIQEKRRWYKALYLVGALICCMALILTQARGPWMATTTALIFVGFVLRKQLFSNKRSIGIACIFIGLLCVITTPLYVERVKTITDLTWASNYHRLLIWQSSIAMIQDYPFTGVGLKMFNPIYNSFYISPLSEEPVHLHAHNSILMYAVENGLANAMIFIYLLYKTVSALWQRIRYELSDINIAAMASIIAILINSMVDSFFWSSNTAQFMWFLIGMSIFGASKNAKHEY